MEKRTEITGSASAKLVQLMRQIGHNVDVDIQLGTVIASPPAVRIKLDLDGVELRGNDLIIAESLTQHTRTLTFAGNEGPTSVTFHGGLTPGDRVIVACMDEKMQYVVLDKAVTY